MNINKSFKSLTAATIFSMVLSPLMPVVANAAPLDSVSPATSVTSPVSGSTVSGTVTITATASDIFSSCVVRIFGQSYDVSVLGSTHSGGNVFNCGTNMDAVYAAQHGTNVSRMQSYLIPSTYTGVTKVDFYVDGALIGTDTTSPYDFNWNTASTTNGSHSIQAKAFDGRNTGSSSIINVSVNNVGNPTPTPTPNPPPTTTTPSTTTIKYKNYKTIKELREVTKKLNKILKKERDQEMRGFITELINDINTKTQSYAFLESMEDDD